MEKGVTPLCGSQRMENGECKLPFCSDTTRYLRLLSVRRCEPPCERNDPGEKQEACCETFSDNSPFFTR